MAKLAAFTDSEQLNLDDMLVEFRDASPPQGITMAQRGDPRLPAGAEADVIRADLDTQGDVSQVKIGTESHNNGLCPYLAECYEGLGLVTQHCAWNLDNPPTWRWCGGYKRRNGGIR